MPRNKASRSSQSGSSRARSRPTEPASAPKPPPLTRVPKTERILNLIAFLLRSDAPVPVETIFEKIRGYDDEASRESLFRRFERDKKVLRDAGVPLDYVESVIPEDSGYCIPRESYYLDEVRLPPESVELLRALAQASNRVRGRLRDDLRSALIKLGFDAPELTAGPERGLSPQLDLKLEEPESAHLEALSEAVLRRQRVRLTYYTIGRDETCTREVDPYGLGYTGQGWHQGAWYLVGYCHLRKAVRVFRLSRIRGEVKVIAAQQGGADFELPADFRLTEHLSRPLWEQRDLAEALRGGDERREPMRARIRVAPAVFSELCELLPAADAVTESPRGPVLELAVVAPRPFLRFLLRYYGHIEVLAPNELSDSLRAFAREILGRYGEASP